MTMRSTGYGRATAAAAGVVVSAFAVQGMFLGGVGELALQSVVATACRAAVVVPFLAVGVLRASDPQRAMRLVAAAGALYAVYELALRADLPGFAGLGWNFDGKLLALVALAVYLWRNRALEPADAGVTTRLRVGHWSWWLAGYVLVVVPAALVLHQVVDRSAEQAVYQLTVRGLDEELVYRGVLLLLLDRAFGTPWRVYGIRLGWGFVCSTVLFVAAQVVYVSAAGRPYLFEPDPLRILWFVVFCLAVTLVRHATGSVWAAAMLHNVGNAVLFLSFALLPVPDGTSEVLLLLVALALARHASRRARSVPAATEERRVRR
ncbi:MAG: CPBP family glutamic-type intramembrane protease [Phycicoccus sp.]